jgi:hypothetical protein
LEERIEVMPSDVNLSRQRAGMRVYSGLLVIVWLGYVGYVYVLAHHPALLADARLPCLFKEMAGLPCPFCGVTRSLASFIRGDFKLAFLYNPFSLLFFSLYTYHLWTCISNLGGSRQPVVSARMYKVWLSLAALSWIIKLALPQKFW